MTWMVEKRLSVYLVKRATVICVIWFRCNLIHMVIETWKQVFVFSCVFDPRVLFCSLSLSLSLSLSPFSLTPYICTYVCVYVCFSLSPYADGFAKRENKSARAPHPVAH